METRFDPYPYLEVSQINGHIRPAGRSPEDSVTGHRKIRFVSAHQRFAHTDILPTTGSTWINKHNHSTPSSLPKKSTNDGCSPSSKCVDPSRRQPTTGSYPPVQKRPKDCVNESMPVLLPWCLVFNGRNRSEFVSSI